jgi:hypothetical protein
MLCVLLAGLDWNACLRQENDVHKYGRESFYTCSSAFGWLRYGRIGIP